MRDTKDRERVLLVDVSTASNSALAIGMVEDFAQKFAAAPHRIQFGIPQAKKINLNAGPLMLSSGVLVKIKGILKQAGFQIDTIYSKVPQTQMAALDEGYFVRDSILQEAAQEITELFKALGDDPASNEALMQEHLKDRMAGFDNVIEPSRQPEPSRQSESASEFRMTEAQQAYERPQPEYRPEPKENIELPRKNPLSAVDLPKIGVKSATASATTATMPPSPPPPPPPPEAAPSKSLPQRLAERLQEITSLEKKTAHPHGGAGIQATLELPPREMPVDLPPLNKTDEIEGVDLPYLINPKADLPTMFVKQNLRSGQMLRYDGHIVIIGDVHAGAEVAAGGDVVVWGELKGIAHAGSKGNYRSEVRALRIEAIQLRIADFIARRPDRVFYHKDQLDGVRTGEVARVADGEIKIFQDLNGK